METLPMPAEGRVVQNLSNATASRPRRSSRSLDTTSGTEVLGRMTRGRGGLPPENSDSSDDSNAKEEIGRRRSGRKPSTGTRTQRSSRSRLNEDESGGVSDEGDEFKSSDAESSEESSDGVDGTQTRRSSRRNTPTRSSGRSSTRIRISQASDAKSSKRPTRSRRNTGKAMYRDVDSDIDMEEEAFE